MTVQEVIDYFANNDEFNAFINYKLELNLNTKENKLVEKISNLEERHQLLLTDVINIESKIKELNSKKTNLLHELKQIIKYVKKEKNLELTDAICIEHLKKSKNIYKIYLHKKILL